MNYLALIFGIMGVITYVASIQFKKKSNLLNMQLVAYTFYSIQYLLLNALSAGFITICSCVRCVSYNDYETKGKKIPVIFPIIFITIISIISIITYDGIMSLIPCFINITYTLCTYSNDFKKMRFAFLICAVVWIIYNYSVAAYAPVIGNIFEIISCIVALKRFNTENKND